MKPKEILKLVLLPVTVFSSPTFADIDGGAPRSLEVLLDSAQLVVIARPIETLRTTMKVFEKNVPEPFAEVYTHYQFVADAVLKGELGGQIFDVRVLGGRMQGVESKHVLEFEPDQELLLLLTPDSGKDPSGNSRKDYLIPYRAAYPIFDGSAEVRTARGHTTVPLERVKDVLAKLDAVRLQRIVTSDEPNGGTDEVTNGEEGPMDLEPAPPPSQKKRDPGLDRGTRDSKPEVGRSPDEKPRRPRFTRGDANDDGAVNMGDGIRLLGYLFRGGQEPNCVSSVDANDDGFIDLSDAIFTLNFLFVGEARLPEPYPGCGGDPSQDALSCEFSPKCQEQAESVDPVEVVDREDRDPPQVPHDPDVIDRDVIDPDVIGPGVFRNRDVFGVRE